MLVKLKISLFLWYISIILFFTVYLKDLVDNFSNNEIIMNLPARKQSLFWGRFASKVVIL